jgi:hypothetical protein
MVSPAGPSRVSPVPSGPARLGVFASAVSPFTPSGAWCRGWRPCAAPNGPPDGVAGGRRKSLPSANFLRPLAPHLHSCKLLFSKWPRVSCESAGPFFCDAAYFLRNTNVKYAFGENEAPSSKQLSRLAGATDFQSLIPVWVHLCNKQVGEEAEHNGSPNTSPCDEVTSRAEITPHQVANELRDVFC